MNGAEAACTKTRRGLEIALVSLYQARVWPGFYFSFLIIRKKSLRIFLPNTQSYDCKYLLCPNFWKKKLPTLSSLGLFSHFSLHATKGSIWIELSLSAMWSDRWNFRKQVSHAHRKSLPPGKSLFLVKQL